MKLKINQNSSQCPQNISTHSTKTKKKQNKNITFLSGRRDKTRGIKDRILKFVPRWVVCS